ncbi:hypothetical protein [Methanotorris formicicus]|uniref:Uncharacterized protein n=1 Tax=Methanotorris formicicus Mc-S-70 TaxID=647171 RepID=H1L1P2_9EURY|nr:hypothetical protein [Methanotorris formicicus]EHP83582.1 hypothetical protein MetfoDRAFT_1966 [Methanotorris formicicus Mc-S-70]
MSRTVNRKIYFYQIIWVKNNNDKVMENISFISNILDENRIIEKDENTYYTFEKFNEQNDMIFGKLHTIRKGDLPLEYDFNTNKTSTLNLPKNKALCEPTHFIIFDGRIIGAEFNYYGPRISVLKRMINKNLKNNNNGYKKVEIKPILKTDLYDLLDEFVEIRGISIKIATDYAKLLANDSSFKDLFSAANLVDNMWLSLSISVGRKRNISNDGFSRILNGIKKLLRRNDYAGNVDSLKIRGRLEDDGSIEEINLIEELLISEKKIAKLDEKSRCVDSMSMYEAILESYNSLRSELEQFIKSQD